MTIDEQRGRRTKEEERRSSALVSLQRRKETTRQAESKEETSGRKERIKQTIVELDDVNVVEDATRGLHRATSFLIYSAGVRRSFCDAQRRSCLGFGTQRHHQPAENKQQEEAEKTWGQREREKWRQKDGPCAICSERSRQTERVGKNESKKPKRNTKHTNRQTTRNDDNRKPKAGENDKRTKVKESVELLKKTEIGCQKEEQQEEQRKKNVLSVETPRFSHH